MRKQPLAIILLVIGILAAGIAHPKTITVSGRDSEAIAAAIAESGPGDTVSLPAGTYAIRRAVQPKSQTRLTGAGEDATVLRFTGESPSVIISLADREDVEIRDLTLDGAGNPNATQGISAGNARHLNLHHLIIRDLVKTGTFGPHGVLFSGRNPTRERGVTDSEIADCRIENIGLGAKFGGGIRLAWGSSRNRVLRNIIHNTGRGGIFADNGSTDVVIQSNTVSGSGGEGLGIEVWGGCDRAVIEDNRIDHWLSIGGCDYCAVRRNVISDNSGAYKFCGIEGIGSYLVITDNTVHGGQKIGLSVSGPQPKQYVYWARNTVRECNQWGAQFQGEGGGIAYHYLYRCKFLATPIGLGPVWYPGDEGHGFRTNGNCQYLTFEECEFSGNDRLGIQLGGANVDCLSFVRCAIKDNKGPAVSGPIDYSALEWTDCAVEGNASNALPAVKPFPTPRPGAAFDAPTTARVGEPVLFTYTLSPEANETAPDPTIGRIADTQSTIQNLKSKIRNPPAVLWGFGDGPPSTNGVPSVPATRQDRVPRNDPMKPESKTQNRQSNIETAYTYTKPGSYLVTLLVWDTTGRAARAERRLTVTQ